MLTWFFQYRVGTLPPFNAMHRDSWLRAAPLSIVTLGFVSGVGSFLYWTFIRPTFWGAALPLVQLFSAVVGLSSAVVGGLFLFVLLRLRRRSDAI